MPQRQPPQRPASSSSKSQAQWRLIEGGRERVLKAIDQLLEGTGDNHFEIEFRIHESRRVAARTPKRKVRSAKTKKSGKSKRSGVFATVFGRRTKKAR